VQIGVTIKKPTMWNQMDEITAQSLQETETQKYPACLQSDACYLIVNETQQFLAHGCTAETVYHDYADVF
jgi:hypothetical protein